METFPRTISGPIPKGSHAASRLKRRQTARDRIRDEFAKKREAKRRDGLKCRMPLCGCGTARLRIDASHDDHKGMGGNPSGDRNVTANLITLCSHRHQDGVVSVHRGTLRPRYLTDRGSDGPIAWDIHEDALARVTHDWPMMARQVQRHRDADGWVEVARETGIQRWERPNVWQLGILAELGVMDL